MIVMPSLSWTPLAFFLRPLVMSNLWTPISSGLILPSIHTSSSLSTPGFSHGQTWLRFDLFFFVELSSSSCSMSSSSLSIFFAALAFSAWYLAASASSFALFLDSTIQNRQQHYLLLSRSSPLSQFYMHLPMIPWYLWPSLNALLYRCCHLCSIRNRKINIIWGEREGVGNVSKMLKNRMSASTILSQQSCSLV